ncbi:metal ABC transporter substrate-binding protein [Sphaerothrix gracilis]|uniref:metal ABC transporter substrate-binding protein n=1 Tax=Sphaerothrix gracilis TaxID=3151835 RepID=UPI0031FDE380
MAFNSARLTALVGLSLAVALVGCQSAPSSQPPAADAPLPKTALPKVVATTSVLCDLAQQLAQSTVTLTCLMSPGQDPHTYQARPADRQALDQADLVLYGGYSFAPNLESLIAASRNQAVRVAVYEAAVPQPLAREEHGHDSHGHEEDEHDSGSSADPHIWHDATHNAAIVEVIAAQLADVHPEQAEFYQTQADQLSAQFAELDRWIQDQVATVPAGDRKLVTTHNSFQYFAAAYGFEVAGALSGLSTAEKPAAGDLTALVDQVKAAQVPTIFAETTVNPKLMATVARDAGVEVAAQPLFVEGPGGVETAAATTQAMLVENTCVIVTGLGGSCDRSSSPLI